MADINPLNDEESKNMDAQIDHAAGMPIELLDELPPPVDATESLFSALQEPMAERHAHRILPGNLEGFGIEL